MSARSSSTRRSPRSRSRASGPGTSTRRSSTRTAGRSRSVIRSARPAPASSARCQRPARVRASGGVSPRSASASDRGSPSSSRTRALSAMVAFVDDRRRGGRGHRRRGHRAGRWLRLGGPAGRAHRGPARQRRDRPDGREQQRRQRRHRPGRADPRGPGAQDGLLVPAAVRLVALRREVPRRRDRARTRPAGQPRRTHPRGRRRHRRRSSPRPATARRSPRARRPARSTAAATCWSTRSTATSRSSRPTVADELGNLVYRKTARNFGPIMAAAATTTVVQVDEIVAGRRPRPGDTSSPRASTSTGSSGSRATARRHREPQHEHAPTGLDRDTLARTVAADIPPGRSSTSASGCPRRCRTTSPPDSGVMLHTENGMLGMGPGGARRRGRPRPDQRRARSRSPSCQVRRTSTTPTRSR